MSTLKYELKNSWETSDAETKKQMYDFSEDYKNFLNTGTTERLCVKEVERLAKEQGFCPLEEKKTLKAGDKVYVINRGKNICLVKVGKKPIKEGMALIASHIDCPRLDLKPVPLFEDTGIAYFKTHYYGGIKKYQWTALPLGMHGIIFTKTGSVEISVDGEDICFCISDLLPHLAVSQMTKPMKDAIDGESLNVIVGTIPGNEKEEKVKNALLALLNEKYGIIEEDFISAELEIYPALPARDVGFDRSLVGSYGHDDRVCAYTSLRAIFDSSEVEKTAVCFLADKEEIGSMGNTGMKSSFFENIVAEMISLQESSYNDLMLRRALSLSVCLSADVCAAFDPTFASVYEKRNTSYIGSGISLMKYTGSRGKSGSSDASAELIYKIRNIFDENDVVWQICELGKVDEGGGGTVAQYIANLNVDVVDCGVPIISMHAPFELASKADIYMTYKGYKAFFEKI